MAVNETILIDFTDILNNNPSDAYVAVYVNSSNNVGNGRNLSKRYIKKSLLASLLLQVNGVNNPLQSVLNLIAGSNITLTPNGVGGVTIASTGGGGGTYTVDNGLTENPANNFQLGGTLLQDTTIDTGIFILNLLGNLIGDAIYNLENTAAGGFGAVFKADDNAVVALSNIGEAIFAQSTSNIESIHGFTKFNGTGDTTVLKVDRIASSSGGIGVGASASIDTGISNSVSVPPAKTSLKTRWESGVGNYSWEAWVTDTNVLYMAFKISPVGQLRLPKYGTGTPFTGTVVKALGVDSSGNVIEFTPATGGGTVTSITAGTGLSATASNPILVSGTIQLNSKLAPADSLTGNALKFLRVNSGETAVEYAAGASPLTTKGDLYTFDTADARLPVGLDTQVLLADSTTATGLKWGSNTTPPASGYYLAISDSTDQTNPTANTPRAVKFNTIDLANGFSLQTETAVFTGTINNGGAGAGTILNVTGVASGTLKVGMVLTGGSITAGTFISAFTSGTGGIGTYEVSVSQNRASATYTGTMTSEIVCANTGVYNIQFSSQMDKSDAGVDYVNFWLRKNGADIPESAGVISLQGNAPAYMMAAWNYLVQLVAGDVIELYWGSADVNMEIIHEPAQTSPFAHPAVQSTILTITQQAGILAGTGITGLGKAGFIQTGATQTLVEGTSGTDFNIVSSSNTQTFNIPSASALNRGLLLAADWTTFNGKLSSTLADTNILVGNVSNVATAVAMSGDATLANTGALTLATSYKLGSAGVVFDGAGGVITTNTVAYVQVPYNGTITGWTLVSSVSGSCTVTAFKDTYANFPPTTTTDDIFVTPPAISAINKAQNLSAPTIGLFGTVTAGDWIGFRITGITTVTWVNLTLSITKTL